MNKQDNCCCKGEYPEFQHHTKNDCYSTTDHYHCWQQEKPPCGQKIEHLKCCLCEKTNPKIFRIRNEAKDVLSDLSKN